MCTSRRTSWSQPHPPALPHTHPPNAQFGCLVVNAPTANTIAAAEHGIAMLCALSRNIAQADASMKAGKWQRSKYVGASLVAKQLAIIGFGKVRVGLFVLGRRGRSYS